MSSLIAVLFAVINMYISTAVPPETCNYVYTGSTSTGQAYAVDVCRTIVLSGVAQYRKYICDGDTIKDQIYNDESCNGNPLSTETPTITSYQCGKVGSCNYIMMKTPCSSTPTTYSIQPVLTDTCIVESGTSYYWSCDGTSMKRRSSLQDTTCTNILLNIIMTAYDCDTTNGKSWEGQYCSSIHYGPSTAPTQQPTAPTTATPTEQPTTASPTAETQNPTTAQPTEDTTSPSSMPSKSPTTRYPTSTPTVPINDQSHVLRIGVFVNIVFIISFVFVF